MTVRVDVGTFVGDLAAVVILPVVPGVTIHDDTTDDDTIMTTALTTTIMLRLSVFIVGSWVEMDE
jgi:hypothetical protein